MGISDAMARAMTYSEKWYGGRDLFIKDGGKIWEWPIVDEVVRVEYMKRFEEGRKT